MRPTDAAIPSLDGIRAVSVILVIFSHVGLGHIIPGGLGVTIFFFLSGYLITTLLISEFQKTKTISIGRFYVRRFLRLSPPLLITLAIAYFLVFIEIHPGGVSLSGALAQIFYFANYYSVFIDPAGRSIPMGTGVLWSLAVEEHFYLAYPGLLLLLMRKFSNRQTALALVMLSAAILLWRYYLAIQPGFFTERTYYLTDTRIDSIMWGCILALLCNPWTRDRKMTMPKNYHFALLALAFATILLTLVVRDKLFRETLRYTLQGIALMPIFYFAIRFPEFAIVRWLNWSIFKKIGVYSYAIYLIHLVVVYNLQKNVPQLSHWLPLMVVTVLISVAYAAAIERWVDAHLREIRARWR